MKHKNFLLYLLLSLILSFNVYAATVSHNASEINPGTFPLGDFTFQGNLQLQKNNEVYLNIQNTELNGRQYALVSAGSLGGIGVGKFSIYDIISGTSRLTIDTIGNVGIGTTGPSVKLDVHGNNAGTSESIVTWSRLDGAVKGVLGYDGNNYVAMGALSDHDLSIRQNNIDYIHIKSGGNVGIGTTGPGAKLDVVGGYAKSDTGFCIGGSCITTWPSSSGGTVTSISAGTGITLTPNPITATGAIAVKNNAFSCSSGQTLNAFNINDGTKTCAIIPPAQCIWAGKTYTPGAGCDTNIGYQCQTDGTWKALTCLSPCFGTGCPSAPCVWLGKNYSTNAMCSVSCGTCSGIGTNYLCTSSGSWSGPFCGTCTALSCGQ